MFDFLKKHEQNEQNMENLSIQCESVKNAPNTNTTLISVVGLSQLEKNKVYDELYKKIEKTISSIPTDKSYREEISKNIKKIVSNYDDDILFELINKYITRNIIWENLYDFVPSTVQNAKHMIFICVKNHVPIYIIEKLVNKIDINFIGDNGCTCLFRVTDLDYLIRLLSSKVLNFNINHINKDGYTFLSWISKGILDNKKTEQLISILVEKGYDFNRLYCSESLLDFACLQSKTITHMITSLINNAKYDITLTTLWFYIIINEYSVVDLRNVIIGILSCPDYKSFLNKIMNKYTYGTADNDMLLVMNLIEHTNAKKLVEMVKYKNDEGNNFLHIASFHHLDKCIRYLTTDNNFKVANSIDELLEKNNNGDTPLNLYSNGTIEKLLHQNITLLF